MTGLKLHYIIYIVALSYLVVPFYHIHCFCNEITTMLNITFENSMLMVPLLVIKSETFCVQYLETLQANPNIEILFHQNEMPTCDPKNGYLMYRYMRFPPADYS